MKETASLLGKLEVRVLPLESLKPAPYNPRQRLKPGSPAYRKLETSLREFGLVEPLIWNETTGFVVGGHARLEILRARGVQEVPVSVVHLDPAREKALNVVLNNREAQARFDPSLLNELLTELKALPEMELTGFEPSDLPGLQLEPVPERVEDLNEPEGVEVTLAMDEETYKQMAARLDELIAQFDLVSHVRHVAS